MAVLIKRYAWVGPACWAASLQYYVVQLVVARGWARPYSWGRNTISDLGVTSCGTYGTRLPCSPLHGLMNASFIVLGLGMVIGAALIYPTLRHQSRALAAGFGCIALGGVGTIAVGLFPENTVAGLHFAGALLPFLITNAGLVVLGLKLNLPKLLRGYTIFSGLLALAALGLFYTHIYLGLGIGGMERVTAYPQSLWLIVIGWQLLRSKNVQKRLY